MTVQGRVASKLLSKKEEVRVNGTLSIVRAGFLLALTFFPCFELQRQSVALSDYRPNEGPLSLLETVHADLAWPEADSLLSPKGAGAAVQARLAQDKIGIALQRLAGPGGVRVGVVVADPNTDLTATPIAIVCEFGRPAPPEAITEAHRLAWNFCRAPLLVTLEPHQLRAWSCFEAPRLTSAGVSVAHAEIVDLRSDPSSAVSLFQQAARSLSWVHLVTGEFFRTHAARFPADGRADRTLLANLSAIRAELVRELPVDVVHDLLARLVFVQFLFDRKDSSGQAALDITQLARLTRQGVLSREYQDLADILRNYDDTYRLFGWLNQRFNGDLFPGTTPTDPTREREWEVEAGVVTPRHLNLLADFVAGRLLIAQDQYAFWRLYAFDTIPLEFISSVYEEFVHRNGGASGVHYTPLHLVDFVLDGVLPWNSEDWNLRVLDPACGSGVFLVKAFQRLVHRWKRANRSDRIPVSVLRALLENNLFGVDIDEHAARVASFSLYLAMCDEIDPRDYWTEVTFPYLRNRRIAVSDFFAERESAFSSTNVKEKYDLVVGNAPWGKRTITPTAREWAASNEWGYSNEDIGTLFIAKAITLLKSGGYLSMIQPAGTLLLHRWTKARQFRRRLFREFKVEEVANLTLLRFQLFPSSVSPACTIILRNVPADGKPVTYICPKLLHTTEDQFRIAIDAYDVHSVDPEDGAENPWIWTALVFGGIRDLALLRRLSSGFTSIAKLQGEGIVTAQEGVIINRTDPPHPLFNGRRFLSRPTFPAGTLLHLAAGRIPRLPEIRVYRRTNPHPELFEPPQLVVKQSLQRERGRFQAALVIPDELHQGIVCTQSYISVRSTPANSPALEAICLAMNSTVAVYYLLMTSSRMSYRSEVLASDLYDVPLPRASERMLEGIVSVDDVDLKAAAAFELSEVDQVLIHDAVTYALPELTYDQAPRDRSGPDDRSLDVSPDQMQSYTEVVLRVLQSALPHDKSVCATVFDGSRGGRNLPMRLVAVHLGCGNRPRISVERPPDAELHKLFRDIHRYGRSSPNEGGNATYQRVTYMFDTATLSGLRSPTVYLLKPAQVRYWTRAAALRDADLIVASGLSEQLPGDDLSLLSEPVYGW